MRCLSDGHLDEWTGTPQEFAAFVRTEYLAAAERRPRLDPDSVEAAEAVQDSAQRAKRARAVYRRATPQERSLLMSTLAALKISQAEFETALDL